MTRGECRRRVARSSSRQRRGVPCPGYDSGPGALDPRFEYESCGVGFVCDIEGRAGRGIVDDARRINCCMEHRGGIGSEPNTGDGAGILTALPHKLLARFARTAFARTLPEPGRYGVGNMFLPHDPAERRACKERIEGDRRGAGPGMPWLARAAARPQGKITKNVLTSTSFVI